MDGVTRAVDKGVILLATETVVVEAALVLGGAESHMVEAKTVSRRSQGVWAKGPRLSARRHLLGVEKSRQTVEIRVPSQGGTKAPLRKLVGA